LITRISVSAGQRQFRHNGSRRTAGSEHDRALASADRSRTILHDNNDSGVISAEGRMPAANSYSSHTGAGGHSGAGYAALIR